MIRLACTHCGSLLQVKDELAGKRLKCPSCKQMFDVGLAAGVHDQTTLPPTPPPPADETTLPPGSPSARPQSSSHRRVGCQPAPSEERTVDEVQAGVLYQVTEEIARGGMGAVMRAVDRDIQREVAVKFLLKEGDARQKARFIEEAQITGQLEHPNIVPIHQLGVAGDGRCFFSMKMVKGQSRRAAWPT